MGLIITPQSEIDKYFESDALSQSKLKKLLKGFDAFLSDQQEEELYYEEKDHFIIGSAVDCILTGEKGIFEKKYYVSKNEKKPSKIEMSIIQMTYDEIVKTKKQCTLSDSIDILKSCIIKHNWYNGKPGEKRIHNLIEKTNRYFEDLKLSSGKQIINQKQKKLIDNIVESLKTDGNTEKYFNRTNLLKMQEADIYYQLPIYFKYKNVSCKALLDLLIVFKDKDSIGNNKISALHPIDLKTMAGNNLNFPSNVRSYRYDIQAAWYTQALLDKNSSFNIAINNKIDITEDMIKNFTFIVESNTNPGRPLIYETTKYLLKIGKKGRNKLVHLSSSDKYTYNDYEGDIINKEIKGFDKLLDEYIHYELTGWKEDILIENSKGCIKLNWDGIQS